MEQRSKSFYKDYFQTKQPDLYPKEARSINRQRGDFNLSNKF
jgi:hypothetical protein